MIAMQATHDLISIYINGAGSCGVAIIGQLSGD
jgi:hypothetical protein